LPNESEDLINYKDSLGLVGLFLYIQSQRLSTSTGTTSTAINVGTDYSACVAFLLSKQIENILKNHRDIRIWRNAQAEARNLIP
jgi:hypothetical protein